jgi:S-adenosylmethionine/arginine decarboxylase-like enzyme
MPFGYSFLIDAYGVKPELTDSLEVCYRFLEELVDKLGMDKASAPLVIHGPKDYGVERRPDLAGISAFIPLLQSGIAFHSVNDKGFITIDVYSCSWINEDMVIEYVRQVYNPTNIETHFVQRGVSY